MPTQLVAACVLERDTNGERQPAAAAAAAATLSRLRAQATA
jgi:hypothetical protein